MTHYYYLDSNRKPVGPVTFDQLRKLTQDGALSLAAEVAAEGGTEWLPLSQVLGASSAPPPSNSLPSSPQRIAPAPGSMLLSGSSAQGQPTPAPHRAPEPSPVAAPGPVSWPNPASSPGPVLVISKQDIPRIANLVSLAAWGLCIFYSLFNLSNGQNGFFNIIVAYVFARCIEKLCFYAQRMMSETK